MKHIDLSLLALLLGCGVTTVSSAPLDGGAAPHLTDTGQQTLLDAGRLIGPGMGSTADTPGFSCLTLKTERPDAEDGLYWINPVGGSTPAFQVFCDITL